MPKQPSADRAARIAPGASSTTVSGHDVIAVCQQIAAFSESPYEITRTFLCSAMQDVHRYLGARMRELNMTVTVDAIGNLRGLYPAHRNADPPRLLIGSHLDTVPNGGAYDGALGVVLGMALVESLGGERLPFAIEVAGFSEEEGVRFAVPFLGSKALVQRVDAELLRLTDRNSVSVADAIRDFGLNPENLPSASLDPHTFAYLEFHIEQGPVLYHLNQPLGIVDTIAGQSRYSVTFTGEANHAGTTPMNLRRDALAGAAEWISAVEAIAQSTSGLVATVSTIESDARAGNVIAGRVAASLDVRHALDEIRRNAVQHIVERGLEIARARGLQVDIQPRLTQAAVPMDPALIAAIERATLAAGYEAPRMVSGAGHDAMILAEKVPSAMIFLPSPEGVSHHPDEIVREQDVDAALAVGRRLLTDLAERGRRLSNSGQYL